MKHIFFSSLTKGETWEEKFYFSSDRTPSEGRINVAMFGESTVFNGCNFSHPAYNPIYSLEFIIRGNGSVTYSDGSKFRLSPGTLFIVPPELSTKITVPTGGELIKTVIGFHNGALLQLMLRNALVKSEYAVKIPTNGDFFHLLTEISGMIKENADKDKISAKCYHLLLFLQHDRNRTNPIPSMQKVCEYMQLQLNTPITLDDLAKAAGTSQVTLIRNFKTNFGCTPIQYLIDLRMNYARSLLQMRNIPVQDVAALCGYNSPKFFSREYRKKFGIPPSDEKHN